VKDETGRDPIPLTAAEARRLFNLRTQPARPNSTSTGQAGDDAKPQHANPTTPEDSEITGLCCSTSRFVNEVCVESGDCLFKQAG
jgi:hypothetical protein